MEGHEKADAWIFFNGAVKEWCTKRMLSWEFSLLVTWRQPKYLCLSLRNMQEFDISMSDFTTSCGKTEVQDWRSVTVAWQTNPVHNLKRNERMRKKMSGSVQHDQFSLSRPSQDVFSEHIPWQSITGHRKRHYQFHSKGDGDGQICCVRWDGFRNDVYRLSAATCWAQGHRDMLEHLPTVLGWR